MAKYRKKPVVIEAFQYGIDPIPDWFWQNVHTGKATLKSSLPNHVYYDVNENTEVMWCEIETLEGVMRGNGGDFIIKGVKGEIYPCKPDVFEMTYEPDKGEN